MGTWFTFEIERQQISERPNILRLFQYANSWPQNIELPRVKDREEQLHRKFNLQTSVRESFGHAAGVGPPVKGASYWPLREKQGGKRNGLKTRIYSGANA